MGLIPRDLPDSSQWKWTSTDLIIKPKALINANVNLPHNPTEWALTSDSCWSKLLAGLEPEMVFLCWFTITSVHNSWRLWRLQKIWFIFFPVPNLCSAKENVDPSGATCWSNCCDLGPSIKMCPLTDWTVCPSVAGSVMTVWLRTPAPLFPHLSIPYGAGISFSWISVEKSRRRQAVQVMVWSHDRLVCNVFRISARYHDCILSSVTFKFPAATGNQMMAGQHQCIHVFIINNIIDQSAPADVMKIVH